MSQTIANAEFYEMTAGSDWPAGTRVRCLDNRGAWWLKIGAEYRVFSCGGGFVAIDRGDLLFRHRFKPVVRVKMGRRVLSRPLRAHGFKADEPIDLLGMLRGDYLYA